MDDKNFSISVCIPVWKGSPWLKKAIDSVYAQSGMDGYDFEIVLGDDNPPEFTEEIKKTREIIDSYNDERINYIKNEKNLGYPLNLRNIVSNAKKDIIFLMAQDDVLSKDAVKRTIDAFKSDDDIGVVTRPYFWFIEDITAPVRAVTPPNINEDTLISINDDRDNVLKVYESIGQLSGLAYRKDYLDEGFHEDVFPAHIYPFVGIFKNHKCMFLKDYTLAVRIESSQTIYVSSIYDKSPVKSWVEMFNNVLKDDRFKNAREWGIENITTHFLGLVQIRNYAKRSSYFNEIYNFATLNKNNLLNPLFYIFTIGLTLCPRVLLIKLVDHYKKRVLNKKLTGIKFNSALQI